MGLIGKVKSFTRFARLSRVKADVGGGEILTGANYSAPGDDSQPLPADYVVMVPVPGTGKYVAVGYLDPNDDQTAGAGEKRIYSRDGAGATVAEIWLKSDGTVVVNGAEILLGKDAINRLIDERLIILYNGHTHSTTIAGNPTGSPLVQLTANDVATVKTKAE